MIIVSTYYLYNTVILIILYVYHDGYGIITTLL